MRPALAIAQHRLFVYTRQMKLTIAVKLQPTPEQAVLLRETTERANAACNHISAVAWETQTFGTYALQKATYYEVKDAFGLTAQMVVRCVAKVADAYKLDKKTQRIFRPLGAIAYDDRILRWQESRVSIWVAGGKRQWIPFICGPRERVLLANRQGESDLLLRNGIFYLYTTVNVEEPPEGEPEDVLGIDMGIVNIATTSDGDNFAGAHLNSLRARNRRLRKRLQHKGTKSAKRLLVKRRRKEARFATSVNHTISKRIVAVAQGTNRAIALENLSGIRDRVSAQKPHRAALHSWSFHQLRQHIEYKACLAGVRVIAVDPRNTSRTCPCCGHISKANRPHRDLFLCVSCGFDGPADYIASLNLRDRGRAAVNPPYAGETTSVGSHSQAPAL